MSGTSTIDLAGTITTTSSRRSSPRTLMQTLAGIEAKDGMELTVPHQGSAAVPLALSSGVAEALMVVIYSPRQLVVEYTSNVTSHTGPMRMGIKGYHMLTLTPSNGITAITIYNADETEDVTVEYTIGAMAQNTDDPPDFYVDSP